MGLGLFWGSGGAGGGGLGSGQPVQPVQPIKARISLRALIIPTFFT
jgi:hypothetical protein